MADVKLVVDGTLVLRGGSIPLRATWLLLAGSMLALFAVDLGLSGRQSAGGSPSLAAPIAGPVAALEGIGILYVLGLAIIVVGLGQFLDAWKAPFTHDVLTPDAPHGNTVRKPA